MNAPIPATAFATDSKSRFAAAWRRQTILLGAVAILLIGLFHTDAAALARIWWTSTTFGHCLFIGPVIGWLVWQRRRELAEIAPVAWWPGLAIVGVGGFGWLLGDAAGVALARHLGLCIMLQGAVVTLLGPSVARGLAFPLAYAFFLVPFGEGLEPPLQTITVAMTMPLLHLFGVPAHVDGVLITIPNGYFEVAEACSGAKFVIAMIAYGALVANVCFLSWHRRAIFMGVALVVPVLANGLRAFGTIYAAHLTSVAPLVAAALVLATAALFPAYAAAIDRRVTTLPDHIALPDVHGWHRAPMSVRAPWAPNYPGADHYLIGRYVDTRGDAVDLAIAVYGSQHEGKELVAFGVGALREDDVWVKVEDLPDLAGGSAMRVTAPGPVERQIATWYRVGDTVTADDRLEKLATLKAKLLGGPQRAVAVHLSAEALPGHDPRAAITRFLTALGPIDRLADRSAGLPTPR